MVKKGKVVIVDDDTDLLSILKYSFESKGYSVVELTTGKSALEYVLDQKNMEDVSLLVLDRMLPDMEGMDILDKVKKECPKQPPVLILSALKADKDVVQGLKKGAVDYIGKPFNQEIFMQKAMKLIG